MCGLRGRDGRAWTPVIFARMLLPLVQLPPAGHWDDRAGRLRRRPAPAARPRGGCGARALALPRRVRPREPPRRRRLGRGRAARLRRGVGAARTVTYRDEAGTELLDLPGRPLPPATTPLPVRLLAHWDQPLLAYADRERILPPAVQPLKLTLSGDPTVTVDGRVAASWTLEREGDVVAARRSPRTSSSPAPRAPRSAPRRAHGALLRARRPHATKSRGSRTTKAAPGAACSLCIGRSPSDSTLFE